MAAFQLLDDALADDVVRETAEGLGADDVFHTFRQELQHFPGQEPALAGLVAQGDVFLRHLGELLDLAGCGEAPGLKELLPGRLPEVLQQLDGGVAQGLALPAGPQILILEVLVVEAVEQEVHEIRHDGLGTLALQELHDLVVGQRGELHQNFADDAHLRLLQTLLQRKLVEIADDAPDDLAELLHPGLLLLYCGNADLLPLFVEGVGRAGHQLVGTGGIEHPHEDIAVDHCLQGLGQERQTDAEARRLLHAVGIEGDHRDLGHARLLQRTADEADVVGGTAAAAGLGHDDRCMVEVKMPGLQGIHDLSHHNDGGVAGIVVYIFETRVDGRAVCVLQHYDVVAVGPDGGLNELKVDGRHLRAENGIFLRLHFLGEELPLIACRAQGPGIMLFLPHPDGCKERTDTDPGGAQVVHLVDLQHGIDLVGAGQNIPGLVHGNGVQTAAEGVQLYEVQVLLLLHELRCPVETGVVHPLVRDDEGPLDLSEMGNRILCQHGEVVGGDELRNAVVDLRIAVVGSAGQNDAPVTGFLHPFQGLLALFLHVVMGPLQLLPGRMGSGTDLCLGKVPFFELFPDPLQGQLALRPYRIADLVRMDKDLHQLVCGDLLIGEGQEGLHEENAFGLQRLDIVLDVLRVGGHHRTVVVVAGVRRLIPLVGNAGIEDEFLPLLDEPLDMTVGNLCRIALGLRGDGFNAQLVELSCGGRRQHSAEAELPEENRPEGIVFVHVQYPGNADLAAGRELRRQRLVVEHPLQLVGEEVRNVLLGLGLAETPFTAVAGNEASAGTELVDGQDTVVAAALAAGHAGAVLQGNDLVQGQHAALGLSLIQVCLRHMIAFPGNESGAEGAHDAGDIRPHHIPIHQQLEGPQHRIIIEGTALDHDMLAQLLGVRDLDDLEQGILDDGVGEACGNVGDAGTLLLRLLHVGIHENGTAGAQVCGALGKECLVGEVNDGEAQRFRKGLQEGAAAGGAGLVQLHGVHGAVLDADALHVLTADVQNAVHIGLEEGRRIVVGDGLHLALIQLEGGLQQGLTVAGGAGPGDMCVCRQLLPDLLNGADGRGDGRAVIV